MHHSTPELAARRSHGFRPVFQDVAKKHPDIASDHCYVDAMALNMIRKPWDYDMLPVENQFGDVLSDLGAGLIGAWA